MPPLIDLTAVPSTDPTLLYRSRDEIYATDMLVAALKGLDFFTWIDAHPGTLDDVMRQFDARRRPADVMTTLFVAMGLLVRDGPRLEASELAREHLVTGSPWFIGPYYPRLTDRPIAGDLIEILRTGQPARFASRAEADDWHVAMHTEAFAEEFLAAMDCRGTITGAALARRVSLEGRRRLLDIGGGSGIFACAFAATHPELQASVLEKAPVDRIAARAIARWGFEDRVDTVARDMLAEPLPDGYDVHLFSNVLHDWDVEVVDQLLRASSAALPSGGLLIVHDAFLNAGKTGPFDVAAYSVLLMHVTQGRCYSVSELTAGLLATGFAAPSLVPTALGRGALVAVKR